MSTNCDFKYLLQLCAYGNEDFRQTPGIGFQGLTEEILSIDSLEQASAICQKYIARFDLGGGNWGYKTGAVFDLEGNPVAWISYNGRCWKEAQYTKKIGQLSRPQDREVRTEFHCNRSRQAEKLEVELKKLTDSVTVEDYCGSTPPPAIFVWSDIAFKDAPMPAKLSAIAQSCSKSIRFVRYHFVPNYPNTPFHYNHFI
jgi:hypothetical protein